MMLRTIAKVGGAVVIIALGAQQVHAQAANGNRTIWDGVYTEAQATRGERAAQQNCGACHSAASEWAGSMFIRSWSGRPIGELHSQIRSTMPFDAPGRLSPQQYADIVAYMLKLNKVPAGASELPSDEASLGRIRVTQADSK